VVNEARVNSPRQPIWETNICRVSVASQGQVLATQIRSWPICLLVPPGWHTDVKSKPHLVQDDEGSALDYQTKWYGRAKIGTVVPEQKLSGVHEVQSTEIVADGTVSHDDTNCPEARTSPFGSLDAPFCGVRRVKPPTAQMLPTIFRSQKTRRS